MLFLWCFNTQNITLVKTLGHATQQKKTDTPSTEWCRKIAQSLVYTIVLQPFAVESSGLHQNAPQRSLSANQCKMFVTGLNIL